MAKTFVEPTRKGTMPTRHSWKIKSPPVHPDTFLENVFSRPADPVPFFNPTSSTANLFLEEWRERFMVTNGRARRLDNNGERIGAIRKISHLLRSGTIRQEYRNGLGQLLFDASIASPYIEIRLLARNAIRELRTEKLWKFEELPLLREKNAVAFGRKRRHKGTKIPGTSITWVQLRAFFERARQLAKLLKRKKNGRARKPKSKLR